MVGGEITFVRGHVVSPASSDIRYFRFNDFKLSPAIRYYFRSGKWSPFASLENVISIRNIEDGPLQGSTTGSEVIAGLGFNYFLGQNITLETKIQSNVVGFGSSKNNTRYLGINTGIKLFFGNSWTHRTDSISSKILKRGVFVTSSTLGFKQTLNNFIHTQFNIHPNIKYFITDRLNLSAQLGYSHFSADGTNSRSLRVGLGIERYFDLTERLFLNLSAASSLGVSSGSDHATSNLLSVPLEIGINYFTKQKRLYLAGQYSYLDFIGDSNIEGHRNTFALIAGIDYFVLDNVFVKANLNLNVIRGSEIFLPESRSGTLNVGVGFLLDRNRLEF